jgi:peptide/nickel transport system substrate-binding protein
MKRKLALLLSLVLVFSLVLSGCGNKNEAPADTEGGDKVEKKEASNNPARSRDGAADTLVVGTHEAKGDFLPGYSSEVYDSYVADLVFDGLFGNDKEGNPTPSVAKDWEISEDHKTYTFHLRDDVKFSDGETLTAEDVKFTYEFLADPTYDGPRSSYVMNLVGYKEYNEGDAKELAGVKVIDDYTVAFEFQEALSTNIWDCGMAILPKHIYDFEKGDTASLKQKMSDPDWFRSIYFEKI